MSLSPPSSSTTELFNAPITPIPAGASLSTESQYQTERAALALKAINDGLWDWKIGNNEIYFSPHWKQMLGYADNEISNNFHGWQSLIHPDDLGLWLVTWSDFMESSASGFVFEYRIRAKDNSWRWVQCHAIGERDANGALWRIAGCHTDITLIKQYEQHLRDYQLELEKTVRLRTLELEHANTELRRLASLDHLTSVMNRSTLEQNMLREWARARRNASSISVIMADIDHFKNINDTYGHPAGDACLIQVANALRSQLNRPTDGIYRYGGEEFVVLLPDTRQEGALEIAERMRIQVEQISFPPGTAMKITISMGTATTSPSYESEDWLSLIAVADCALYHAKENGRNQVIACPWAEKHKPGEIPKGRI